MKFVPILGLVSALVAAGKIDPQILENINSTGSSDIVVSFKNSKLAQVRDQFMETHKLSDRSTKLNSFHQTLKDHADQTQSKVLSSLEKLNSFKSAEVRQLWITNQLIIRKASEEIIQLLQDSDEISNVEADRIIPLLTPTFSKQSGKSCNSTSSDGTPWGIARIEASKVWADGFRGQGVVVSNVDTGVQYTHEALRENYRAEYGWYDPYEKTTTPNDQDGHGTHTMGTLVGRANVIGVAPEAQWIACKGCSYDGCAISALVLCGQWTACPHLPNEQNSNCSMAPMVSSNSWAGPGGSKFYDEILNGYEAVGIHAVFAIGNMGSSCASTGYPGESPKVIGVGATTMEDSITGFSSVGPPSYGNTTVKPDVSAPGHRVCSASHDANDGYTELQGTSMACPHVAGLVALLLSKDANLSVNDVRKRIRDGVVPTKSTGGTCGGLPDDKFPNFHAGYGGVSAAGTFKDFQTFRVRSLL